MPSTGPPRSKGKVRDAIEGVIALLVIVGLVAWFCYGMTEALIWSSMNR